jgi:hypothetical protein
VHKALQEFNRFQPIGHVGTAEDVAEVVSFLLSDNLGSPAQFGMSMAA